jgi:hypothetical protein
MSLCPLPVNSLDETYCLTDCGDGVSLKVDNQARMLFIALIAVICMQLKPSLGDHLFDLLIFAVRLVRAGRLDIDMNRAIRRSPRTSYADISGGSAASPKKSASTSIPIPKDRKPRLLHGRIVSVVRVFETEGGVI